MLRPFLRGVGHWNFSGRQGEDIPKWVVNEVNEAFQFIQINRLIVLVFFFKDILINVYIVYIYYSYIIYSIINIM